MTFNLLYCKNIINNNKYNKCHKIKFELQQLVHCLEGTGLKMGNKIVFLVFYIINYESDNLIYSVLIQTRKNIFPNYNIETI